MATADNKVCKHFHISSVSQRFNQNVYFWDRTPFFIT